MKTKFEELCKEYKENKNLIEQLTKLNEETKTKIIKEMHGQEQVIKGEYKATYKEIAITRLDSKALKQEHPDIYTNYSKTTKSNRFVVA